MLIKFQSNFNEEDGTTSHDISCYNSDDDEICVTVHVKMMKRKKNKV